MIWLFIAAAARRFAFSPLAHLFRVAQQYLEVPVPVNGRRVAMDSELVPLSEATLERLRQTLRPRQAEELEHLEQGLPFLATTASVAPFVGLFGTVWGIMQSFSRYWPGEWGLFGRGRARHCGCVDRDSRRAGRGYSCCRRL